MADAGPWLVLALAAVATYAWRAAGVVLSGRIDPTGAVFGWFSCVAHALLAGLVARMVVLPVGVLAETMLMDRLIAVGAGVALYLALGRNLLLATLAGTAVFVAAIAWRAAA